MASASVSSGAPDPYPTTICGHILYCGAVILCSFMLFSLPIFAEPQHFSVVEKIVFAGIVIASGYLFWRRFRVVLNKVLKSKKDPSFHLFPLGKRVWDFFWEVLCQAKVIRERPLPGLAHACVFWAFMVFALVTLNHCAVGLGFEFLSPYGFAKSLTVVDRYGEGRNEDVLVWQAESTSMTRRASDRDIPPLRILA